MNTLWWISTVVVMLAFGIGDVFLSETSQNMGKLMQCTNTSSDLFTENNILSSEAFPSNFRCNSVNLPNTFEIPNFRYFGNRMSVFKNMVLDGKGFVDICSQVRPWEISLNTSCTELLCESSQSNLTSHIYDSTGGKTQVRDWINYCQYCTTNSIANYEQTTNKLCSPKDGHVKSLLRNFPRSRSFCGIEEFGIPILIDDTQFTLTSLPNYFFVCYCPVRDLFSIRCNPINQVTSTIFIFTILFHTILYGILFLGFSIIVMIPKLLQCIKKRSLQTVLPSLFMWIALALNTSSFILTCIDAFTKWRTYLSTLGVACMILGLFAWQISWYRIVHFARSRNKARTWWMYILLVGAFALIAGTYFALTWALAPDWIGYSTLGLTIICGLVAVLAFVIASVWVNRAMKKISDINMLNSSVGFILRYLLIFHSLSNSVHCFQDWFSQFSSCFHCWCCGIP